MDDNQQHTHPADYAARTARAFQRYLEAREDTTAAAYGLASAVRFGMDAERRATLLEHVQEEVERFTQAHAAREAAYDEWKQREQEQHQAIGGQS